MTKQDMIGANDLVLRVMELYPDEVMGFCYESYEYPGGSKGLDDV